MKQVLISKSGPGWALGLGAIALVASLALPPAAPAQDQVQFRDPLNDQPLEIPRQDVSAAVARFHATGQNPYAGDQQAIEEGKKLYQKWCQPCHLADGTGRIGPNLVDEQWRYERTGTDVGQFEIIYAGGAGAMQGFGQRLGQDEILRLIAFVHSLGDASDAQ